MKLTLKEYEKIFQIRDNYINNGLRHGQSLYNAISDVNLEIANNINNTSLDPFYNDKVINNCIQYLKTLIHYNIFSAFDGMSCAQIAFNKADIKYNNYYASEICKAAIDVTMDNYPNTKQLGDIRYINMNNLDSSIDIIVGGSPCQSFSLAGKKNGMTTVENIKVTSLEQYLELKESNYEFVGQSYLFWEYVRLFKESEAKYFFLENVMMKKEWEDIISKTLDTEPIILNSSNVSIQSRKRLYWTNIPFDIKDFEDRGIFFYNEYSETYDPKLILKGKGLNKLNRPRSRVYSILSEKLPTLLKEQESKATDSIVIKQGDVYRYPTIDELEKMQTVPLGYTKKAKYNDAAGMLGNGWTVDLIVEFFKNLNK